MCSIRDKVDMAVRLFNALRSEAQFLRLIVQDATNSLAVAYKVCHPLKFICDIAFTYSLILLIQQFHVSSINWNFGRVIFCMVVMGPSVVLGHGKYTIYLDVLPSLRCIFDGSPSCNCFSFMQ